MHTPLPCCSRNDFSHSWLLSPVGLGSSHGLFVMEIFSSSNGEGDESFREILVQEPVWCRSPYHAGARITAQPVTNRERWSLVKRMIIKCDAESNVFYTYIYVCKMEHTHTYTDTHIHTQIVSLGGAWNWQNLFCCFTNLWRIYEVADW